MHLLILLNILQLIGLRLNKRVRPRSWHHSNTARLHISLLWQTLLMLAILMLCHLWRLLLVSLLLQPLWALIDNT